MLRHSKLKNKNHYGFTLVEILLAIFIFAIIVTTIFGSFNSIFTNSRAIAEDLTSLEMAKNCLNRMIVDLESLHVYLPPEYSSPDFDDPPDPYRIVGDEVIAGRASFSRLRFTSFAHLPLGKKTGAGIAEIIYYVQATDDNDFVLKRSDSLYPYKQFEEKRSDPALCENVRSLEFEYIDIEGDKFESWDSDSKEFGYATPVAINIKLELGDDSYSTLFETMMTLPVIRQKSG